MRSYLGKDGQNAAQTMAATYITANLTKRVEGIG